MIQKFGVCILCNDKRPLNSRGECPDCIYKKNHGGMGRFQISLTKVRYQKIPEQYVIPKRKKVKKNGLMKNERLEKRRGIIDKDEETYEAVFNLFPNECEECGASLPDEFRDENGMVSYRIQYSHILGKGAFPEFRHEPRNFNRLCGVHHHKWEFGERSEMCIFLKNQETIKSLINEKNERKEQGVS